MKLRQMEIFHAYMATGSTVEAADLLGISQPAVSSMLKRIEEEQNILLFRRMGGRLVPTTEARALFNQVRTIHEDMAQLGRLVENLASGHKGSIRVGVVPALSYTVLPMAIKAFKEIYPDIYLTVEVHNSDELSNLLIARRMDVILTFGDQRNLPMDVTAIVRTKLVCVVPLAWAKPGAKAIGVHDLANYPIAGIRASDPIGSLALEAGRDSEVELRSSIELRNCRAALAMAEAGLAIALVDPFSAYHNLSDAYVTLPLKPSKGLTVSMCALQDQGQTKTQMAFRQCLVDAVRKVERASSLEV